MLFQCGQVVATPGALDVLYKRNANVFQLLARHLESDWGDLDKHDKEANQQALTSGARILSAYQLGTDRVWIITEAEDDDGVRNSTCVMLPSEY